MCRAVTCKKCGKTTWAGCGRHIDSVMRNIPRAQQCTCPRGGATATPTAVDNQTSKAANKGFFASLFGR